ncbi:MAG: energy transducer TonB [Syntrophobacteraceae bacterium]|nr:energy transducer TonB [Desulfobacteraceae bacterium]
MSVADGDRQPADASGVGSGMGAGGGGVGGSDAGGRDTSAMAGAPLETGLNAQGGPRFLKRVLPEYPRRARELGKEGTVILRVTIDARGTPTRVEALKKLGFGLDDEAVRALENSTFTPARIEGRLVSCRVIVPVRFELKTPEDD